MISFFKKNIWMISQSLKILILYCFKVYRCMNKTHVKAHEKRQGRENKISKNFAKSNNHHMPHQTSSTRNGYKWKINYDWPYDLFHTSSLSFFILFYCKYKKWKKYFCRKVMHMLCTNLIYKQHHFFLSTK